LSLLTATSLAYCAHGQTTEFTYQGKLSANGNSPSGTYDFKFRLYDDNGVEKGSECTRTNVHLDNGAFCVKVDFGAAPFIFSGAQGTVEHRWIEIDVKEATQPVTSYATLTPRTEVTPAPHAIYSQVAGKLTGNVLSNQLSGTYDSAITLNNAANMFSGNGSGLDKLAADHLTTGTLADSRLSPNVALLNRNQTFTGNNDFGNVTLNAPGALWFGATTRQMLNLWGTQYGIGVQPSTHYFRADAGAAFAWFEGGVHSNAFRNPGAGGSTLMTLSSADGLNLARNTSLFNGLGVDDLWVSSRTSSDLTNSYFLRLRRNIPLKNNFTMFKPVFLVRGDGLVGIGTDSPDSLVHSVAVPGKGNAIHGTCSDSSGSAVFGNHTAAGWGVAGTSSGSGVGVYGANPDAAGFAGYFNGRLFAAEEISWGTSRLTRDQNGSIELGDSAAGNGIPYIDFHKGVGQSQDFNVRLINDVDEQLSLVGNLKVSGNASCCSLTIRGGCDLAEPFQMSDREIAKGSLVIIDPENPGKLKLSGVEYDTRVAGIVSGANGINPGISLHQEGAIEGGQNVALSGRVYALADASNGQIKPGDLLTSSGTPGHVMKVTDHARAQGAIVGKAMSGLREGKGMVLVLVSLQ
jgi:hypothetical protein